MPSFHLASNYSKAAVRTYIERKLCHSQSTLDEHVHLNFVVGRHYLCEAPVSDAADASVPDAPPRMNKCVLLGHLQEGYDVELVEPSRRRFCVKALHSLPVQSPDDCDWSDEAYAHDSRLVLAAIAAHFPLFQMSHRRPEPLHRVPWPIKFYHPPGSTIVRSQMHFDEVDYGISFAPFLSEDVMPGVTGAQRDQLMKTVRKQCACCCCV
jgi:hypothetical protein